MGLSLLPAKAGLKGIVIMGGNGKGLSDPQGNGSADKDNKLKLRAEELGVKLPPVLSSYMTGKNLPREYKGIEPYVAEVRKRILLDLGQEPTQLQTILLDGICETLMVLKYISAFMGENPGELIVGFNKFGQPVMSDLAIRGFSGMHQVLDKKIKQFHDMTAVQQEKDDDDGYLRAVMGDIRPVTTGKPRKRK